METTFELHNLERHPVPHSPVWKPLVQGLPETVRQGLMNGLQHGEETRVRLKTSFEDSVTAHNMEAFPGLVVNDAAAAGSAFRILSFKSGLDFC